MTTIFDNGSFWIEYIEFTLDLVVNDTDVDSAVQNLAKPGSYVGGAIWIRNSTGNRPSITMESEISAILNYGDALTGILCRGQVEIGVPVTISIGALVFLTK